MIARGLVHHAALAAPAPAAAVTAREGLSTLYDLAVELVVPDPDLDLDALVGEDVRVELEPPAGGRVLLHGVVAEAEYLQPHEHRHLYRLRARPRLASLGHRVRSRIFQERSATEVVKEVLRGAGIPGDGVAWSIATYPRREYLVQWKESELAFVLRLLEDAGIFFWFEHAEDGHVLHLADALAALPPMEGDPALPCLDEPRDEPGAEWITGVALALRPSPDAWEVRDWNWQAPAHPVAGRLEAGSDPGLERHEYPAAVLSDAAARRAARDRLLAARVGRDVLTGVTSSARVAPGRVFELTDVVPPALAQEWRVVALERRFEDPALVAGGVGAARYRARFEAIPAATEFRPARRAPRPSVHGKESAVVTGPPGEEIHVDTFGRVKVHFYWDREGKVDEHASCWLRVQQQNTAGNMILPRVGWEVDVGFLGGDPDRPVVLQKLYNRETMPPYALPDHLTHAALQSSSSPGGGGTNEIRMNDSAGGMELFVHSQRDLDVLAGHDLHETVANDAKTQVGADATAAVEGDEAVQVGADRTTSIGGARRQQSLANLSVRVGGADDLGVGGNATVTVAGNETERIGAVRSVLAAKVTETVNGDAKTQVGAVVSLTAAGPIAEAVAGSKREVVGGARVQLVARAKAESVEGSKTFLGALLVTDAGKDVAVAAEAAVTETVGGPVAIRCGGDFAVSGAVVSVVAASATLKAGGEAKLTPGSVVMKGGKVGGKAPEVQLKGTIDYV